MDIIAHQRRYLPHELKIKIAAVKMYRQEKDVSFVCRRYKISKASLMRWNKAYDGSEESLRAKSHRPKSKHPRAHTEAEEETIRRYVRRNPNISGCELYGRLRKNEGYTRSYSSMHRMLVKLGLRSKVESTKKKSRHTGHYDTPTKLGEKWQMDVKYVPTACYAGTDGEKFYQYTMIDEASRQRYIYAYKEQSGYSTVDFVKRAIHYFRYQPKVIQTDNGSEFTNFRKTDRVHIFDQLCAELGITHKLIRPRTPWHNGKVERSHRNDQERFYDHLSFYSFEDLKTQMRRYLSRSNGIPMMTLGWKSPIEKRAELMGAA